MINVQEPPFAIQVEATEGCNLRCGFCGLNGIRGKDNDFKFMTVDTAQAIAVAIRELGWNPRIEFAMHGEPTFNPCFPDIIQVFRRQLPACQIMVTSNGGGLIKWPKESIATMFEKGADVVALDQYQNINTVPKIFDRLKSFINDFDENWSGREIGTNVLANEERVYVYRYPYDLDLGNPHRRYGFKRLIWISPIDLNSEGTHAALNNHAGAGAPKNKSAVGKRCAKPFREMSFRWDGSVALCCNDWRGEYVIGNIHDDVEGVSDLGDVLNHLWNHPRMQAARVKLYHRERNFGPCDGCDALSYRVGLLPDKKGKDSLPLPAEVAEFVTTNIQEAMAAGPLTKPVLREWEK